MKPVTRGGGFGFSELIEKETDKLRRWVLVLGLLILGFGLTSTTYLNQRTTCDAIYSRYEAISDSLARELLLGSAGTTDALLETFRSSLGPFGPRSLRLHKEPPSEAKPYQCSALLGWTRFEIPVFFGNKMVGLIRGRGLTRFDFILPALTLLILGILLHWYGRTAMRLRDFFQREIIAPLHELSMHGEYRGRESSASEVASIAANLTDLKQRLVDSQRKLSAIERDAEIGRMAAQVAHDIRSPLAALKAIRTALTSDLPELDSVFASSLTRLESIARTLLEKGRQPAPPETSDSQPIGQIVRDIITEKQTTLGADSRIQFKGLECEQDFWGRVSLKNRSDFERILSNLISNSIDALSEVGRIEVGLDRSSDGALTVEVEDTGSGIPAHLIPRLTERGATFGKKDGNGLGLYHASETLKSWGGTLHISSTPGKGTRVRMLIPAAQLTPIRPPTEGRTILE